MKGSIKTKPELFINQFDSTSLNQWVKFYGVFMAKDNYPFMLLGNHQPFDLKHKNPFNHPRDDRYVVNGRSTWVEALIFRIDNVTLIPYSEAFRSKYMKESLIYPIYNIFLNKDGTFDNSEMLDYLVQYLISKKNSYLEIYFPQGIIENTGNIKTYETAFNSYLKLRGVEINRLKLKNFDEINDEFKKSLKNDNASFYFKILTMKNENN